MRKNELIKALKAIPGNPRVVILDVEKNHESDTGEGTAEGCHGEFEVFLMPPEYLPPGQLRWIAMAFVAPGADVEIDNGIHYETPQGLTDEQFREELKLK